MQLRWRDRNVNRYLVYLFNILLYPIVLSVDSARMNQCLIPQTGRIGTTKGKNICVVSVRMDYNQAPRMGKMCTTKERSMCFGRFESMKGELL